jgi:tetratricopeptide (TPR) repeat protein
MNFEEYVRAGRAAMARGDVALAVASYRQLAAMEPENAAIWRALAAALHQARDTQGAKAAFERSLALQPSHAGALMGLGHTLRALGRPMEAAANYRLALAAAPDFAEAWWSLASLKMSVLGDEDSVTLQALAANPGAPPAIFYALGRALDAADRRDEAFAAWSEGGRRRLREQPYEPASDTAYAARMLDAFTLSELARLRCEGTSEPKPIFIVGLPRSGSTLIERILAAHPMVAAADEPPFLGRAVAALGGDFPSNLSRLSVRDFVNAAEIYRCALATRGDGRPVVVDKNPNNFWLIGFIACAMPEAVVIHARRDPLDACFSAFTHLFPAGFPFSSSLEHLGFYSRLVQSFMREFSTRARRLVHVLDYEALVSDQEGETRRLLEHCGLPWDERCLAFHQSGGVVHTPSAEQVARPIYASAIGAWRRYDKHLEPLKRALEVENPLA